MKNFIKKNKLLKSANFLIIIFVISLILYTFYYSTKKYFQHKVSIHNPNQNKEIINPSPGPLIFPTKKIIPTDYHIFQTYNNCGPASLSMALHFYGIEISQEDLGKTLRPYQIQSGDNDDKSVTLEELGNKAKDYGLIAYHRPMGNSLLIKKFIANDIPVITRTITKPGEDIGHYRIIKGYDEKNSVFIQDDSLQGKNLYYTYEEFSKIWKIFNYEYLALVPKEKQVIAEQILGENNDLQTAWQNVVKNSQNELSKNPNDIHSRFNLSVAYYNLTDYRKSVIQFEKVEKFLSFRTLWYQIEPIEAYFESGDYNKVFKIIDQILNNQNKAFSELYILRGKIYQKQGNTEMAKSEFQKALFYNSNLEEAKKLLNSI